MAALDPIANMLTIIRNAIDVRKETVDIPASKLNEHILGIMKKDGYIEDVRLLKDNKQGVLKVYLKYEGRKSVITGLKRVSRSGLRVYVKNDEIPRVLSGLGTAIISSSQGIIDDKQARQLKTGGEVLCYVW
ncbi:MAG: 30S ribosomal protein S8 [Candidatus Omnitrophota bacterium]